MVLVAAVIASGLCEFMESIDQWMESREALHRLPVAKLDKTLILCYRSGHWVFDLRSMAIYTHNDATFHFGRTILDICSIK